MKNVTVSMPEDVAQWTRVEAARSGKSVSRFLSDMLTDQMGKAASYRKAESSFFSRTASPLSGGTNYPTRDEIHGR